MKINLIMCGVAAVALSACDSSEGGGNTNAFAFSSIGEGTAAFSDLSAAAAGVDPTNPSAVPNGSFRYDGLMSVILEDDTTDGVLGTMRLNVGFDDGSLSGSAGSFRNFSNEAVDGDLNISGDVQSGAGAIGGQAQVTGTVAFEAGTMSIVQTYTHVFTGPTGEYNIGSLTDGEAQPATGPAVGITSAWATERQ